MSDSNPPATFVAPSISELAPLFPGYEIETLIATGGMGAVYRAIQKSLDRTVAIKILPQEFSKDAAFCAGFEAEAKAMARLNHPNLIGVYDFGEINGMLYIIMEYVPGESLFHASNGIALDQGEVIRLVSGICEGLAHAHENGILHRDIKPSNILLDLDARPKIGDFGLARPVDRKVEEGEEIFGTPHYTAPEVVSAPHTVNNRADIFSVGVLLHELLTGKLPADDRRGASAIIHCDPRFDAIIRRATSPIPEARYASASEITRELEAIASSAGPRILRTATPAAAQKPAVPHRYVATPKSSSGGGVIILAVVVVVAIVAFLLLSRKPADPSPEVPKFPPTADATPANPGTANVPDLKPTEPAAKPEPTPMEETPEETSVEPEVNPGISQESHEMPDSKEVEATDTDAGSDTTAEPAAPKFDIPSFYDRARRIMREKAAPMITAHASSLEKNLDDFERGGKRLTRKMSSGNYRDRVEESFKTFIETCRNDGNRLPKMLDPKERMPFGIDNVYKENLKKQEDIDESLNQALTQLGTLYVAGIEKQIERLKTEDDPGAVAALEEEVKKSKLEADYFPSLMTGTKKDSDEDTPENPDVE